MSYFMGFFMIMTIVVSLLWLMISAQPAQIASAIRLALPVAMIGIGSVLTYAGRGAIGLPLIAFAVSIWARMRSVQRLNTGGAGQKSTVRSAWLEMELDHETGDMDGTVLTGKFDGRKISDLSEPELLDLYEMLRGDGDSAALLEAYLDRIFTSWREHAGPDTGSRQSQSSSSGAMDKEEAYQVLGLSPSATTGDIRNAHRRLMKRIHPDSGGSTFLAAKINEAKDVLLN